MGQKEKRRKEGGKKETLTAYDKLFKGKKAVTADGFMKMHLMNGKVYVEFPLNLLNKDMMLTSSIEDISDNGRGLSVNLPAGATISVLRNWIRCCKPGWSCAVR